MDRNLMKDLEDFKRCAQGELARERVPEQAARSRELLSQMGH